MRLFIYCADPREKADLGTKIDQALILPGEKVARISLFGGPIFIAHPIHFRDSASMLLSQIDFAVQKFLVEEIVAIGHDCGFYDTTPALSALSKEDKQRDILRVRRALANRHPARAIRAFFDSSDESKTCFESLTG
jgi:hypothetical protein